MKLKDSKDCQCPWQGGESVHTLCRFKCCLIMRCPDCNLEWGSVGPVACPCKKNENGTLRWYKYPDMDKKVHVAVKENKNMRKPKRSVRNLR